MTARSGTAGCPSPPTAWRRSAATRNCSSPPRWAGAPPWSANASWRPHASSSSLAAWWRPRIGWCHRNTIVNRLSAFENYTGLDLQKPRDAALALIAVGR